MTKLDMLVHDLKRQMPGMPSTVHEVSRLLEVVQEQQEDINKLQKQINMLQQYAHAHRPVYVAGPYYVLYQTIS